MDLKKLTRLLIPILVEGVLSAKKYSPGRFIEKLNQLEFITRSIVVNSDEILMELQILDTDLLYNFLAGEANNFFLASRISHDRANQTQSNNASWQAVEHYYSAYYAVHYLIRLTGVCLTNLDAQTINVIQRSQWNSTSPTAVPSGLYVIRYDDSTNTLTLKKNQKKGSGGSHLDAWQLWEELIDRLRDRTNIDPVEYASTSLDLTTHKSFLLKSTAKYSPPEIRGEINYQFKGGTWVFEKDASASINRLQRAISESQSHSVNIKSPSDALISNNKIIICLAQNVFLHSCDRYPSSICRLLAHRYSNYLR